MYKRMPTPLQGVFAYFHFFMVNCTTILGIFVFPVMVHSHLLIDVFIYTLLDDCTSVYKCLCPPCNGSRHLYLSVEL